MPAYATKAQLDAEVAARAAADTKEVNARTTAVNTLDGRTDTLEAQMANVILRVEALEGFQPPAPPDPPMPVASFVASPPSGVAPLTVSLVDGSTNATSWAWTFGDGGTSTSQNPTHQYAGVGSYQVGLTVTNASGSSGPVTRTISVLANPPVVGSIRVTSITALLNALADNAVAEIVVANGSYTIGSTLDIGSRFAGRTLPVLIRPDTPGGVTFDHNGTGGYGSVHMLFRDGAHHQEWRGFKFGNSHPYDNGVIQFGAGTNAPCHDITLRNIEFLDTIVQEAGPGSNYQNGQGIYLNSASGGGNYNLLIDGFTSNAQLWSHIHAYGKGGGNVNCHDVTIRNVTIAAAHKAHNQMGVVLWDATLADVLLEDVAISGANEYGLRHAAGGTGIVLRRVTTTGSTAAGFYSSLGSYPSVSGITFDSCSFA